MVLESELIENLYDMTLLFSPHLSNGLLSIPFYILHNLKK